MKIATHLQEPARRRLMATSRSQSPPRVSGSIEMAMSKHQHERYLREQRDWFSASFAAVPHAVIVTDGSGQICYINPVAEQITGWSTDDALGQASTAVLRLYEERNGRLLEDFVPVAMLQG